MAGNPPLSLFTHFHNFPCNSFQPLTVLTEAHAFTSFFKMSMFSWLMGVKVYDGVCSLLWRTLYLHSPQRPSTPTTCQHVAVTVCATIRLWPAGHWPRLRTPKIDGFHVPGCSICTPLAFKLCYDVLVMQTMLNVCRNEWNDTPSNQTGAISPDRHKHIPVAYKKNFCYTVSGLPKHVLYMCIINKYCLPGYLCFTVLSMFIPVRFIHLFNCFFCQILVCLDDRDKPFVKVQGYCDFISVLFSQRWFHFSSYLDWRMNWLEVTVSPQNMFLAITWEFMC